MSGQLTYVNGDLFTSEANVYAHGCNTRGGYGSGIAGQIARRYPEARDAYLEKFRKEGWKLGQVQFVQVPPEPDWGNQSDFFIANMATQNTYGGPGVHVDYDAVGKCFETVLRFCEEGAHTLAIPKIGAGLAGGDWARIESIIRDLLAKYDVQVTCYTID